MSKIEIRNLSFYYDGSYDYIFEHVDLSIDTRWKLGLTGRNGRGKTTLLKLLMGKLEYQGEIITDTVFDYFPFVVKDGERMTIEVLENLDGQCELWKICREFHLIGLDEDVLYQVFNTLSQGEQTKVLLSLLFARENKFLLIDEPTNHLDMEARRTVSSYLDQKKGFILVSHDREFLDGCVDYILAINRHTIELEKGNFSSWWENRQRREAFEQVEYHRLQKDIRHLKKGAEQAGRWAEQVESTKIGKKSVVHEKNINTRAYLGEKSRKMQQRRKNLERRQQRDIQAKEKLLKDIEKTENLGIVPLKHHKECLVELKDIDISFGDKIICRDFYLEINQGQRITLSGKNGSGKSSILKVISGELVPCKGQIFRAPELKISYVPQDTSYLHGSLNDFIVARGLNETLFLTILRKMDFQREAFSQSLERYSSGQKKKVLLAASLSEQAHLYIWDEPLNYVDIFTRMQIEDFIRNVRPTMLIVEHDRQFIDNIVNSEISVGH